MPKKVMFVCAGNICRSPLAKGLMLHKLQQAGKAQAYLVECSGTGNWDLGSPADRRSQRTARLHGFQLANSAKQFQPAYFDEFDFILAMDRENRSHLMWMARNDRDRAKVHLLREFDPQAFGDLDVPDPYYEDLQGFERLYQMLDRSITHFLKHLESPWNSPTA
jgi:protein-tyrosine phosphatase